MIFVHYEHFSDWQAAKNFLLLLLLRFHASHDSWDLARFDKGLLSALALSALDRVQSWARLQALDSSLAQGPLSAFAL